MAELDNQRRKLISQIAGKKNRRKLVSLIANKGDSRVTIRETDDGLGIHNPTQRFIPLIIFLLLWLGGWSVGEYFALSEIFSGGWIFADLFLIVWVTFWTIGGVAIWGVVLYQLFGVEQLFVTSGAVVHEVGLWKFRRRRVFPMETVSGFALATGGAKISRKKGMNGAIFFDVAGKVQSFGIGMSEDEAKECLAAIKRHLDLSRPSKAPTDKPATPIG